MDEEIGMDGVAPSVRVGMRWAGIPYSRVRTP